MFLSRRRKYFEDNSFNYKICPPDASSNLKLEHYNAKYKKYFGKKKQIE